MKYFSAFSGIGGFELGIGKEHECVGYSEIDKYAIQIYQKHFPEHKNYGDITTINVQELPDFDFFVGGFPCQSFSIAGKRRGLQDTRSTLFFEIARIVKAKKPKMLLLENVKGLLSHDGGETFKTILRTLDELGYDAEWCVLDSFYFFAAPRPRVFIFAMYREQNVDVWERFIKTLPLYSTFCEGVRLANNSTRNEEVRRNSERIIRTSTDIPEPVDGWDTFYTKESTIR